MPADNEEKHLPARFGITQLASRLFGWPRSAQPQVSQTEAQREVLLPRAILDAFPAPVYLLDARRVVVDANRAAHEIFGARIVGHDLAQSLRQPSALNAAMAVLADGKPAQAQFALQTPVVRHFELHAMPVVQDPSSRVRAAIVLLDVTAAHQVEQMRADFVANVSHELRSPLAALTGFIETLKGAAKDDVAARARFLDIMEGEARRMARLIDDLLSLSRVEANEHIRPRGKVNLLELLSASRAALGLRAAKLGIEITLQCPANLPPVAGDHDQLSEVFHNLLDNALKYGPPGQPVNINVQMVDRIPEIGGGGLRVSVQNMGDLISPEHLPRLTERFYRIDKARSRDIGGTGLGLAIVKHIINRHRGRLSIESSRENGVVFSVYLSVVPSETAA